MKVTQFTRNAMRYRKEHRDMLKAGWEFVGEGGGNLWELYRGGRVGAKITEARPSCDGLGIWVKISAAPKQRFPPALCAPQAEVNSAIG